MNITLDPQTEANLRAIADHRHVSIEAYLTEMIQRDAAAQLRATKSSPYKTLHEFLMHSPLRGANLNLDRAKDYPRTIELG